MSAAPLRSADASRRERAPRATLPAVRGQKVTGTIAPERFLDRAPTREEAISLLGSAGPQQDALLAAAAALRDAGKGRVVTYSRKVFIPLTNLCRDSCGY